MLNGLVEKIHLLERCSIILLQKCQYQMALPQPFAFEKFPYDRILHRSILYTSNHIVDAKATPKQSQKSPEVTGVS